MKRKTLGLLAFFFLFSGYLQAEDSDTPLLQALTKRGVTLRAPVEIAFLAQLHAAGDDAVNENVFRSQANILHVLQEFKKQSPVLVFQEGAEVGSVWDRKLLQKIKSELPKNLSQEAYLELAKKFPARAVFSAYHATRSFPDGLLEIRNYTQWTAEQKKTLALVGAAQLLWATGELEVHGADSRKLNDEFVKIVRENGGNVSKALESEEGKQVNEARELLSVVESVQKAEANPKVPVFLIFGENHHLENYSRENLTIRRIDSLPRAPSAKADSKSKP